MCNPLEAACAHPRPDLNGMMLSLAAASAMSGTSPWARFGQLVKPTATVSSSMDFIKALNNGKVKRIRVMPGHYNFSATLQVDRSVEIEAVESGSVVLDGTASKKHPRRVLHVNNYSAVVRISGVNITGGYLVGPDERGAGLLVSNGQVTVQYSGVYDNYADAESVRAAPPNPAPSLLSRRIPAFGACGWQYGGGGIAVDYIGNASLTDCDIHHNRAPVSASAHRPTTLRSLGSGFPADVPTAPAPHAPCTVRRWRPSLQRIRKAHAVSDPPQLRVLLADSSPCQW